MRKVGIYSCLLALFAACQSKPEVRISYMLEQGWLFTRDDSTCFAQADFQPIRWQSVTVPHDWAIYGPFSDLNDAQTVAISQNLEETATLKTGRTGGLPYVGTGWYRCTFDVPNYNPNDQCVTLLFDGAMSDARVYVNGQEVCYWPYGYNAFHCDVTKALNPDGRANVLAVRLENLPQSSRWYPGAGLYRNIHVIRTQRLHIPVWGTQVTTPLVSEQQATVTLQVRVVDATGNVPAPTDEVTLRTELRDDRGRLVAQSDVAEEKDGIWYQQFTLTTPRLWSPEEPYLYEAYTRVYSRGQLTDGYTTSFGVRSIALVAGEGFLLNGKVRKFQGVCNHHDLGPLGAAVNTAALRRQLTLLKDVGCDAIRTSHNMPAPELVALCDEMGFMMMVEPFDEWDIAKCRNGYHRLFDHWAEKDLVNMLHHFRNNPSVVLWSIGNEVPSQCDTSGYRTASFLQAICHREDPTRPVTCGMDQVRCVLDNGFASLLDVPGLNYRVHLYQEAFETLPQQLVLGSETASTLSSRGVYHFPVKQEAGVAYPDHQCSSYDVEYCWWSNLPDLDFAMAQDYDWTIGQFVWTGFDYLGEPTPYDGAWPNHSSLFGFIDLASIPKDRYYLYRSVWNPSVETLHILPHWNWEGREGEVTPVYVYTNYPSAELFINGQSQGRRFKNDSTLQHRYRLMWNETVYQPGTLKVVAYDSQGSAVAERTVQTAGAPHHLELIPDRTRLVADGKDLAYVTVRVVDKDGNLCPTDSRMVHFSVTGAATFRATANGDPTSLDAFHLPQMPAFSGQLTVLVRASLRQGKFCVQATADGVEPGQCTGSVTQF